ncbi:MAG: site-2 protease family protein [Polyangiales bacterium]
MSVEFSLFRIPVRIHMWFWLMALLLWTLGSEQGWPGLFIWVAVVFQGILMHELGHALVGRAFGRQPRIELVALGGLTWWEQREPLSPGRSLGVSIAGPAVGIVIGLLALVVRDSLALPKASVGEYALVSLIWVNLGWGLLNLLPVLPLDGGNIVASLMELLSPSRGRLLACYVSFVAIGLLLSAAVYFRQYPATMLLFLLGFSTYQAFQLERQRLGLQPDDGAPAPSPVQQAFEALERGDGQALIRVASELVTHADTTQELDEAFHLLAWGRLINGEPSEAYEALRSLSGDRTADPALEGAVLVELGKPGDAVPLLEQACERGGDFAMTYYQRALREKST